MNNKKLGDSFEAKFSKMLAAEGFWVHQLHINSSGQPADIITAKNGKSYLIDCKECTRNQFDLSRIEDNQRLAMTMWKRKGNGCGWFALKLNNEVVMISSDLLFPLTQSYLKEDDIYLFGEKFSEWVAKYG